MFNGSDEVTQQLDNIRELFPTNSFMMAQEALIHYHNKDYDRAEGCFTWIMMNDPLRLEDMDTFSNILYVTGKRAKLSYLAQLTTAIDKFRPETCCVVGNYHGMKSEHEKAVTYFRRALQLDRNFAAAWTLMGHEYVELKNSQTAIECYRRAVDVNRRDYRAWYGLGQTYELLDMHFYALYYYQRASAVAHADPKMWNAVGACLERLDRNLEAIKAYKRCLMAGAVPAASPGTSFAGGTQVNMPQSMEPEVLVQIAQLYAKLGDFEEAEAYMELTIAQEGTPAPEEETDPDVSFAASTTGKPSQRHDRGPTETTSKARLWLARYNKEKGSKNALKVAQAFATELCEDGYEVEEAKSLIKEIRALSGEGTSRVSGRFSVGPGG